MLGLGLGNGFVSVRLMFKVRLQLVLENWLN